MEDLKFKKTDRVQSSIWNILRKNDTLKDFSSSLDDIIDLAQEEWQEYIESLSDEYKGNSERLLAETYDDLMSQLLEKFRLEIDTEQEQANLEQEVFLSGIKNELDNLHTMMQWLSTDLITYNQELDVDALNEMTFQDIVNFDVNIEHEMLRSPQNKLRILTFLTDHIEEDPNIWFEEYIDSLEEILKGFDSKTWNLEALFDELSKFLAECTIDEIFTWKIIYISNVRKFMQQYILYSWDLNFKKAFWKLKKLWKKDPSIIEKLSTNIVNYTFDPKKMNLSCSSQDWALFSLPIKRIKKDKIKKNVDENIGHLDLGKQYIKKKRIDKGKREEFDQRFEWDIVLEDGVIGDITHITMFDESVDSVYYLAKYNPELKFNLIKDTWPKKIHTLIWRFVNGHDDESTFSKKRKDICNEVSVPQDFRSSALLSLIKAKNDGESIWPIASDLYSSLFIHRLQEIWMENVEERVSVSYTSQLYKDRPRDLFFQWLDKEGNHTYFVYWDWTPLSNYWVHNDLKTKPDGSPAQFIKSDLLFDGWDMRPIWKYLFMWESTFQKSMNEVKKYEHMKISILWKSYNVLSPEKNWVSVFKQLLPELREHENDLYMVLEKLGKTNEYEDWFADNAIEDIVRNMIKAWEYISKWRYIVAWWKEVTVDNFDDQTVRTWLKEIYAKTFWRELVVVWEWDEFEQSLFHIDMFTTYLPNPEWGKPIVVIGQQDIAYDLLKSTSKQERDTMEKRLMLSSKWKLEWSNRSSTSLAVEYDTEDVLSHYVRTYKENENNIQLEKNLNGIAKWFEDRDYIVKRIPMLNLYEANSTHLPITTKKSWDWINMDTKIKKNYITYNNALVSATRGKDWCLNWKVYLPVYWISVIENEVVRVYNELWYKCYPIPWLVWNTHLSWSVNCMTNEVREKSRD